MNRSLFGIFLFFAVLTFAAPVHAQTNLLLNGEFEDINVCSEYGAECGTEAWFYLKDVKVQMLEDEDSVHHTFGKNSFGISYKWGGYTGFTPVMGTILPCHLQRGKGYTFTGWIKAALPAPLVLKPGIGLGPFFYVPLRKFSEQIRLDSMLDLQPTQIPGYYAFRYHFRAHGNEDYLTFGNLIHTDTTIKKQVASSVTVSMVLDHFALIPDDPLETLCPNFPSNKIVIYRYDSRHKLMDYSLFANGKLDISFIGNESQLTTAELPGIPPPPPPDTLKIQDVLFDFNKAVLKPDALHLLDNYFRGWGGQTSIIDSIYVEGHTDSVGSDERNLLLSRERSESVKNWLEKNQVTPNITIHPFGRSRPVAPNSTPDGRALNRRVELIVFRRILY